MKLNLKPDTELGDLISWISSITCKQFILPGTIPANSKKVTVVAPQLITPEEAYRLFLAALDSVGLTVQDSGKFFRIIETVKARGNAPLIGIDGEVVQADRYVTRLVRVEHVDANEVSQVLTRLKTEQGDIAVYPSQSALIITDLSSSVTRMLKILDELDQPSQGEKIWIVRLHDTAATEMAKKLAEIFKVEQAKRAGNAPPPKGKSMADLSMEMTVSKMIPDERSNQLIIIATERAYARVLSLIKKLDAPIKDGDGRIHVYYCENANCDELGQTLGAVTGVAVSGGGAAGHARRGAAAAAPAAGAPAGSNNNTPFLFEGDVRVSFDRPTNSLIILSSLKDYQALRSVIEKLDSPRKQVFVEAMIMEVALDKTRTLGASFHGGAAGSSLFGNDNLVLGGFDAGKTLTPGGLLGSDDAAWAWRRGIIGPPIAQRGQDPGLDHVGVSRHPVVRRSHQGAAAEQRRQRAVDSAPADHEQRGRRDRRRAERCRSRAASLGGAAGGGIAGLRRLALRDTRSAHRRRAEDEAHAARERARHDPPGGRPGDLRTSCRPTSMAWARRPPSAARRPRWSHAISRPSSSAA